MDSSSESEHEMPVEKKQKRPVPVKALEALAKAREMKAKKKAEESDAKKMAKAKKEEAVRVVDEARAVKNEITPPAPVVDAGVPDYVRKLEEKLQFITLKMNESPKKKKKVIVEESDSSEEEVIVKRKVKKAPAAIVEDPIINDFRKFQARQVIEQENAEKAKAERDRLAALFRRN